MSVDHFGPGQAELRLVGYDKKTEEVAVEYIIPAHEAGHAMRTAGVPADDPNVAYSYPLTGSQAGAVAVVMLDNVIEPYAYDYFLEGFALLPEKRPRGRPRLSEDERRMRVVKVRFTDSLKRRMEKVAAIENCSMSHAIELSLERHLATAWPGIKP